MERRPRRSRRARARRPPVTTTSSAAVTSWASRPGSNGRPRAFRGVLHSLKNCGTAGGNTRRFSLEPPTIAGSCHGLLVYREMAEERRLVWDLPLRVFHWLLVLSLGALWATGEAGFDWLEYHMYIGYFTGGLIVF